MAISPGVVGLTRSEQEEAQRRRIQGDLQFAGGMFQQNAARAEQQRQFDITNFNEQVVKPAGGLALLLQTEEGKAAAEPFVAQMLQVKREQPGLLGRFIAEKAPGIAQMLGIDQGEVQSYMSSLADSPLTAEYLQRGAESAFLEGRVTQGQSQGMGPAYLDIAKGVLAGLGAQGAAQPSAPVTALADDRTPPPAPGTPPRLISRPAEPAPTERGGPSGTGGLMPKASPTPDAVAGAAAPGKVEYRVRPDRAIGSTGFVIDEIIDGKVVMSRGVGGKDFMQSGVAPYKTEAEAKAAIAKFGQPSAGAKPLSTGQKQTIVTSDYNPDGTLKPEASKGAMVFEGNTPAPLPARDTPAFDRELMSWIYDNQRQLGVQIATDPRGWSEAALQRFAPGNKGGGLEQQFLSARGGQAQASTPPPSAPASAGTIASAVSAATSTDPARQSLSNDDMMIARWFATTSGDNTLGLQPLSSTEMKQAEVILAKRQRELAGDVRRTWAAASGQSAYNAEKAGRFAGVLQRVGGDVPAELNPFLTGVMTNWANLKARNEAATIDKIISETDLNKAQAQYYLDRLKVESAADQLDFIARMDENSKALVGDMVSLINGSFSKQMEDIAKEKDPKKAGEAFAKLVGTNPILKTGMNALAVAVSRLSDQPLRLEAMPYFYGGFLGFMQKQGSVVAPSLDLGAGQSGLGTDPRGEAAGYVFGGQ